MYVIMYIRYTKNLMNFKVLSVDTSFYSDQISRTDVYTCKECYLVAAKFVLYMEPEVAKVLLFGCYNHEIIQDYAKQRSRNTGKGISKGPFEKWQHLYRSIEMYWA